MLVELHIENLGVIEQASLAFGPGMTALTGETGAGKTMLVEAIELLVGGRADAAMVRAGAAEARVDGRFLLSDGGTADATEIVLSRVVPADGRSRAYVNGRPATAATLSEQTRPLVDLHGQHAHQSLLSAAAQREALDQFGGVDLAPLRAAHARVTEIEVTHHPRRFGRSKYGISRTIRVLLDLLAVKFLLSYSTRPIHIFGLAGLLSLFLGGGLLAYLGVVRIIFRQDIGGFVTA